MATKSGKAHLRRLDGADLERAAVMRAEGMPASWIAEDYGVHRNSILASGLRADPAATSEWRQAWARIRRTPELLALHFEFEPRQEFR